MAGPSPTPQDAKANQPAKKAGSPEQPCSPKDEKKEERKVKLVEFVEVIPHDKDEPTRAHAAREQFINFEKSFKPGDKDKPEYGPVIRVRARLEWDKGPDKKKGLSGNKVYFYAKADPANGEKLPNNAGKTHYKGLPEWDGHLNTDKLKLEAGVNDDGWTDTVAFNLGIYGKDKFDLYATDDKEYKGGKQGGSYEVRRKFWVQYSYVAAMGFNPANFSQTTNALASVMVTLEAGTHKVYAANPNVLAGEGKPTPLYPRWMINQGSQSAKKVPVIGEHNKHEMARATWNKEDDKPLKLNVLMCEAQYDPARSGLIEDVVIDAIDANHVGTAYFYSDKKLVKPALEGGRLALSGTWKVERSVGAKILNFFPKLFGGGGVEEGTISDDMIVVEKARNNAASFNAWARRSLFRIKLPASVKLGSGTKVVATGLKLAGADSYAGEQFESTIDGAARACVLAVYDGDNAGFGNTLSHEIGHAVQQTPSKVNITGLPWPHAKPPPGLPDHPNYYCGAGCHCFHDYQSISAETGDEALTNAQKITKYRDDRSKAKHFNEGSCVMYHRVSSRCSGNFCSDCEPYLRAQDMSSMPAAKN
jgi:hypothetical protein